MSSRKSLLQALQHHRVRRLKMWKCLVGSRMKLWIGGMLPRQKIQSRMIPRAYLWMSGTPSWPTTPAVSHFHTSYEPGAYICIVVSEIDVRPCYFDPWFMPSYTADLCGPSTTKEQDAMKGKWVRVDRNLNAQGMSFLVGRPLRTTESCD